MARAGGPHDSTLVRHIYDLHAIQPYCDPAEVATLARHIMASDADAYGHQFPAYRDNPVQETNNAVTGMASSPDFRARYDQFLRDMVYGPAWSFEVAFESVQQLRAHLQEAGP